MDEQGERFDVVVLGAGPGGYVAAIRAAQLGKRVAVVEEKYWGGVCLNVGCIPTKALLRNAELAHVFTREAKTFGIKVDGEVSFDYGEAFRRSRKVADGRVKGVHYLMKKNEITEISGRGTFLDPHTLQVVDYDGNTRTVGFDHCVIATGATPKLLPLTRRTSRVVTFEEQILAEDLPQSIVIAGAGAIGVEFAYILHNYGVKVTIVEFLDRIAPLEDAEVSAELAKQYRKSGIASSPRPASSRSTSRARRSVSRSPARTAPSRSFRPTRSCRRSVSRRTSLATAWRTPACGSPNGARSTSTAAAAPPSRTSTPSVTSPRS